MNILAINSSPRGGGQSKTELMRNHFFHYRDGEGRCGKRRIERRRFGDRDPV
jgi:hypothetical protein